MTKGAYRFTITEELFEDLNNTVAGADPGELSTVTEAFTAWLHDQATNEAAPDRFRYDEEFSRIQFGKVMGGKFQSIHAYMALNCLFWGFVGAFDYLTAKR